MFSEVSEHYLGLASRRKLRKSVSIQEGNHTCKAGWLARAERSQRTWRPSLPTGIDLCRMSQNEARRTATLIAKS
jgi:hypothetical protein